VSYGEAILEILAARMPEDAHWTVIWDEALVRGLVNPMTDRDARTTFLRDLADAARAGLIEKTSTGTYRAVSA
jgi:hypothetical protein